MYCVAYNLSDGLFLHYRGNGVINAHESKEVILKDVENMYNRQHSFSCEASMSACVHFIAARPIVVEIPDDPEKLIDILIPGSTGAEVFSLNSLTTRVLGLKVKPDLVLKMIEESEQPRLITEDFDNIMLKKETLKSKIEKERIS
jgi:hypothetical protein